MPVSSAPLSILAIHAHPDDEASKGAGTIRRYANEGIRTTLVCCTGGEEGDILNPSMDRPEVAENLTKVRRSELDASASVIGYDEVVMLGYRDSGMPDSEANSHPNAFANAKLDEAVERLVAVIRRVCPQVVLTYPLVQERYPHPDHLQVTTISLSAFERAGDPNWKAELGPAFAPVKLYASMWSQKRLIAMHQAFLDRGLESPFDKRWFMDRATDGSAGRSVGGSAGGTANGNTDGTVGRSANGTTDGTANGTAELDERISAVVEVDNSVRRNSLLAHATQIDPNSPFWFGLPDDVMDAIHPYEEYSLIDSRIPVTPPEDDLFAGLR